MLREASKLVGSALKKGDLVIFESTVFPGATEEICVPILESVSNLVFNEDFFCGYSPERINPGDKTKTLTQITKVTSGSNAQAAALVDELYKSIITAGTHKVSSIRVAEAAKVIENTQRDLNIALINEFSLIFDKLGLDTEEVLEAAETKWNFLSFRPGLVGGHCIGVDPYYLTYKAKEVGYTPELILAGRRLNDGMGSIVVDKVLANLGSKSIPIEGSRVLILGATFKENCSDLRNSKVVDIANGLLKKKCQVLISDPWADPAQLEDKFGIAPIVWPINDFEERKKVDCVIFAVAHDQFKDHGSEIIEKTATSSAVILDLKYILPKSKGAIRL